MPRPPKIDVTCSVCRKTVKGYESDGRKIAGNHQQGQHKCGGSNLVAQ